MSRDIIWHSKSDLYDVSVSRIVDDNGYITYRYLQSHKYCSGKDIEYYAISKEHLIYTIMGIAMRAVDSSTKNPRFAEYALPLLKTLRRLDEFLDSTDISQCSAVV